MDPFKYTFLGHRGLNHCNPMSEAKLHEVLEQMELAPGSLAVDIGCGKAELLVQMANRFGVIGQGVDRSPQMIAHARERVTRGSVTLHLMDAAAFEPEPRSLDVAACLGATEVFGGFRSAVQRLAGWVRPGGFVLAGEGFWQRDPAPEFLAAMEAKPDDYLSHAGNIASGTGLIPLYAAAASADEWDRYEWRHCANIERYAALNPEDPDVPSLVARRRAWRDLYLKWGRDTLGFGLYLFRC